MNIRFVGYVREYNFHIATRMFFKLSFIKCMAFAGVSFSNRAGSYRIQRNSAAERNKAPILEVLQQYITSEKTGSGGEVLLEISSGSGQHAAFLAKFFPYLTIQPTEFDLSSLESIKGYIEQEKVENVRPPVYLDVRDPASSWLGGNIKNNSIDYVVNINMIHISEWRCTLGLFTGCGQILKPGKYLFTYGPYAKDGVIEPESNVRFDKMLRSQNSEWGLRDIVRDLEPLAAANGLSLINIHSMPANNYILVWKRN